MLKRISIASIIVLSSIAGLAQAKPVSAPVKLDTTHHCYFADKEYAPGDTVQATTEYFLACSRVNNELIWLTVDENRSVPSE